MIQKEWLKKALNENMYMYSKGYDTFLKDVKKQLKDFNLIMKTIQEDAKKYKNDEDTFEEISKDMYDMREAISFFNNRFDKYK